MAASKGLQKRHEAMWTRKGSFGAIICVVIGYLLGSINNNNGMLNGMNGGEMVTKTSRTAVYDRGNNTNNTTVIPVESISNAHNVGNNHHQKNRNASISSTSIIEEIIPPNLLPLYAPQKLQFNVTRNMLRQSRPVVGNTERLHQYLRKLHSKKCTTVVFLGGSVTAGHNGGGPANAYPKRFMDWLNEKYPCIDNTDGGKGQHVSKFTSASDSLSHFVVWSTVASIEEFDLVLIEFNVGDSFVGKDLPHALEDKGTAASLFEYRGCWYFEILLRRLLLMRKPDPVAIITFNADYIGRIWAKPPYAQPKDARKDLFRRNQEPLKIWVSSMYEIPVFSAVIWMLPLAGKKGLDWQFNRTHNPYSTSLWHADACCHPKAPGHLILSVVLAYCIMEEEKTMLSFNGFDTADAERDFTMDDPPTMREPLYLSPDEDDMYVRVSLKDGGFDFTDHTKGEQSWKKAIVANEGWTWYADNKDKDKYGYIADGVAGGQHIAISLSGGHYGKIEITFVVSYENFGVALAWLDESTDNAHKEQCSGEKGGVTKSLNAIWDQPASVPKVDLLDLQEGVNRTLHICLTPRGENPTRKGPDNKFKLLGVRLY